MRYIAAEDERLERYEVADGAGLLGIANEAGDITAYVKRADGTAGHAYGGPVYDPPEFLNVCERCKADGSCGGIGLPFCNDPSGVELTDAEKRVATALAHKVGWML